MKKIKDITLQELLNDERYSLKITHFSFGEGSNKYIRLFIGGSGNKCQKYEIVTENKDVKDILHKIVESNVDNIRVLYFKKLSDTLLKVSDIKLKKSYE